MAPVESTALAAGFDGELFGVDERGFFTAVTVFRLAPEDLATLFVATLFGATLRGALPFVLLLAIACLYEAIRRRATCRGQRASESGQGERGGSPARGVGVALRLSQSTRGQTPSGAAASSRSTVCRRSPSSTVSR